MSVLLSARLWFDFHLSMFFPVVRICESISLCTKGISLMQSSQQQKLNEMRLESKNYFLDVLE